MLENRSIRNALFQVSIQIANLFPLVSKIQCYGRAPITAIDEILEVDMSGADNAAFMKRFVEFINSASEKLAHELVSPDAIFHVPGRPEPMVGPAGYLAIVGMMRGGFPDIQWTTEELISEGDKIAVRFTMRGTHRGQFMGVPPTEKPITVQALNIYHLANGRIVKEYGAPDLLGLLAQIGGLPV
jgi:steroid delta-isomerase-like uncharacterized protein